MNEERLEKLEQEIKAIKERNKRVEADKAWETSSMRKLVVAILTYFVIVIYMYSVKIPAPWLNAIVPATAYLLSTLSLPYIKKWWLLRKK
jgi:uncharacterized membrane protein AbrB (regulator of aidB expression)